MTTSSPEESSDARAKVGFADRGPTKVRCSKCGDFRRAKSTKLLASEENGARRFFFPQHPDIAWHRRKRLCSVCGDEFMTGEVHEDLISELLAHRERAVRRRAGSYRAATHEIRTRRKLLDTTGSDVPYELAEKLVERSAWWHTHSSGSPVRAPRHAERLQRLYCGWAVEFGANWFAAGRALVLARDYALEVFAGVASGKPPDQAAITRRIRAIPRSCVLNVNRDLYDDYPTRGSDLLFGAQSIDVEDCTKVLLEVTGLKDLFEHLAAIESDE